MGFNEKLNLEELSKLLHKERIMIVDPGATSRATMFKTFTDLGALPGNINLIDSYQNAIAETSFYKTKIIVAEYDLGKQCGLELLQEMRARFPKETRNKIFIVVTSNTSQTAVAQAAEEDVDAYILKPFTADIVRKTVLNAISVKLKPSAYINAIEQGKNFLEENKLAEAEERFRMAIKLDDTPTLAHYYSGHVSAMKLAVQEARTDFEKGLGYNNVHFKCLVGLFEILMQEKDYARAYEVVRKIARFFPANPKRLVEVLKLAVINRKYDDIEEYYTMFTAIDERDDTLVRHVCTALIICGKYYLDNNARERGIELFQKASATGSGRANFIKEIVQALIDRNLTDEASNFMKKYPAENTNSEAYHLLQFQIMNQGAATTYMIIGRGRELLAKNVHNKLIYSILLKRCVEANLKVMVEQLYFNALKHFPDSKEEFEKIVEPFLSQAA